MLLLLSVVRVHLYFSNFKLGDSLWVCVGSALLVSLASVRVKAILFAVSRLGEFGGAAWRHGELSFGCGAWLSSWVLLWLV